MQCVLRWLTRKRKSLHKINVCQSEQLVHQRRWSRIREFSNLSEVLGVSFATARNLPKTLQMFHYIRCNSFAKLKSNASLYRNLALIHCVVRQTHVSVCCACSALCNAPVHPRYQSTCHALLPPYENHCGTPLHSFCRKTSYTIIVSVGQVGMVAYLG